MKITKEITLVEMSCGECDITFAVPDYWKHERMADGKGWSCPNGHVRVFRDPENARLKRRLEAMESMNTHLQDQLEQAERSKSAIKGQLTKERKRVANGVCPCCNRSFANLHRHMSTQHPEFSGSQPEG